MKVMKFYVFTHPMVIEIFAALPLWVQTKWEQKWGKVSGYKEQENVLWFYQSSGYIKS